MTVDLELNGDDYKCPYCGVTPVYVEPGDGDYYVGPTYICAACAGTFTIQGGAVDEPRAALIRAAVGAPTGASAEGAAWAMEGAK